MFTLPDLPYPYASLEPFIDERTMQIHHGKHHAAYVKNLNDVLAGQGALQTVSIEDLVKQLSDVPENVRAKVRNNAGGHYNHSLFWQMMSPNSSGQSRAPQGVLRAAIDKTFGSFEKFQELFSASAMGRFGSGWAWLVSEGGTLRIVDTPNQDNPVMENPAAVPVLGVDVWEHAYYLKYQNMRADYVTAWWNVVNWDEVAKRYAVG